MSVPIRCDGCHQLATGYVGHVHVACPNGGTWRFEKPPRPDAILKRGTSGKLEWMLASEADADLPVTTRSSTLPAPPPMQQCARRACGNPADGDWPWCSDLCAFRGVDG